VKNAWSELGSSVGAYRIGRSCWEELVPLEFLFWVCESYSVVPRVRGVEAASIFDDHSDGDFGTISSIVKRLLAWQSRKMGEVDCTRWVNLGGPHTCTSLSPNATLLTIFVRAVLSGLGFLWYSASKIA
jgi:hypothetical protein